MIITEPQCTSHTVKITITMFECPILRNGDEHFDHQMRDFSPRCHHHIAEKHHWAASSTHLRDLDAQACAASYPHCYSGPSSGIAEISRAL